MKTYKGILLCLICILIRFSSSAQANTPPVGSSANLCVGQTYRYTSPTAIDGGTCDRFGGWSATNGKVIQSGLNTNGTVWADVQWANSTSGKIGNFCGVLDVSINAIAQPSVSGPSTILLCGSGSITLQATVASMNNIVGFTWRITGTGISPIGTFETTAPNFTINFTNWSALSTTLSATVAVGARNTCGFNTPVTPLTDQNPLPGQSIPAIPRSAWVQLSPGNINDLLAPLSFSPSLICTSGVMTVSNQPANSSLVWSSNNPSALTIDPISGAAARINNYNGRVTVSATLSSACGSAPPQNFNVWLGIPYSPGPVTGETRPTIGGIYNYRSEYPAEGAAYHNWIMPYYGNPLWRQSGGSINGIINTLTPNFIVGSSTGNLEAFGVNACGNSGVSRLRVSPRTGGGGGIQQRIMAFPNPVQQELTIQGVQLGKLQPITNSTIDGLTLADDQEIELTESEDFIIALYNFANQKVRSGNSISGKMTLDTNDLAEGFYILQIQKGEEVTTSRIQIKR
jgi:Secretion system C-terminal sorting domain